MIKIKIYSGLSLSPAQIHEILPTAEVAAPIRRGDLMKDISAGFHVIGIIDGEFLQNLAVSPSEIGDALRCGLRVFGSSSMGALRAVELEDQGMKGVGKVFDFIKSTKYFRDDWLGQIFYEGHQMISMPYMDFYFSAQDLVAKKKISAKEAKNFCDQYEKLHFSERNSGGLRHALKNASPAIQKKAELILQNKNRVKTQDGLSLLKSVRSELQRVQKVNSLIERSLQL